MSAVEAKIAYQIMSHVFGDLPTKGDVKGMIKLSDGSSETENS